MSGEHTSYALPPTVEIIDAWRADTRHGGVDVRTRSGSWRYVTSRAEHEGHVFYWTIRGEGSSNMGRETAIRADRIVQARGHTTAAVSPDWIKAAVDRFRGEHGTGEGACRGGRAG